MMSKRFQTTPRSEPGMVIGVPLPRRGGFGMIVIARVEPSRRRGPHSVLVYGFGPRHSSLPNIVSSELTAKHADLIARAGDEYLHEGRWRVIGHMHPFVLSTWPVPAFKRWDPYAKQFIRVEYSEDASRATTAGERISDLEAATLHWESFAGSGALEYELDDAVFAEENGVPFIPIGPKYMSPPAARVLPRSR